VPELPEVETVRVRLEPHLVGRRFERVRIDDARLVMPREPMEVAAELEGERVAAVERRGKYLIVRFESGRVLLVHLRMTGSVRHANALDDDPYRRAVVILDDGSQLAYRDVRRFGTWLLLEPGEFDAYIDAKLGGEPLERSFTPARLGERLRGRRAPIKAALLDQRSLAGMGNIYADEALWRARLHPLRAADTLDEDEVRRLHRSIRRVLRQAIANRGSSFSDYVSTDGQPGENAERLMVYRRTDQPCYRCGRPIRRIVVGQRSAHYCPHCQPEPLGSAAP
jgi:formamidopyrimidine-DNA glycosylase